MSGTRNVGIPIHFHLSDDLNGHSGHYGQVRSGAQWAQDTLLAGTIPTLLTIALLVFGWTLHMRWSLGPVQTMQCLAYPEPGM